MRSELRNGLLLIVTLFLMCGTSYAQGFHHQPPPPPPPHHQPPPQHHEPPPTRPPAVPPTRFNPPPRPETLRPPSDDQKMLHRWKNKVVHEVRDIAMDEFGLNEETDTIEIEDTWDDQDWLEQYQNRGNEKEHQYDVTIYRRGQPNPYNAVLYLGEPGALRSGQHPPTWVTKKSDPESFLKTDGSLFSFDTPAYTLESLPDAAKAMLKDNNDIDLDNPNLRFFIVESNNESSVTVIVANQAAPGVYEVIGFGDGGPTYRSYQYEFNGQTMTYEEGAQWKDVNIQQLGDLNVVKTDVFNVTINVDDYNDPKLAQIPQGTGIVPTETPSPDTSANPANPENAGTPVTQEIPVITETPPVPETQGKTPQQPAPQTDQNLQDREKVSFSEPNNGPTEQPQGEQPKLPTITELTEMESQQNLDKMLGQHDPQPTEFLSVNGYQPPETKRPRVEPEIPVTKPLTESQLIDFSNDVTFDKFQETVSDSDPLPERIDIQPNYIDLGNDEFGGDVIIDQLDRDTQIKLTDAAEATLSQTSDTTLFVVGTEFPVAGVVISGAGGAWKGLQESLDNGDDLSGTILNMAVGAGVNAGAGILGGKIFGVAGGKVAGKLGKKFGREAEHFFSGKNIETATKKLVDYSGGVITNSIGGAATDTATSYSHETDTPPPANVQAGTYGDDSGGLYINPALNLVK